MSKSVRWLCIVILCLDLVVGAVWLLGGYSVTQAQTPATPSSSGAAATHEALLQLGQQLRQRMEELQRREAELDELLRSEEVLRRASLLESAEAQAGEEETPEAPPQPSTTATTSEADQQRRAAFVQLSKAYENMEPESAARALAELAAIDQTAVVQLLGGWRPRTSGAILDALTQTDPGLAARLSYAIWKDGGNASASAAEVER